MASTDFKGVKYEVSDPPQDVPVEMTGNDLVSPIQDWKDVQLGSIVQSNIQDANYKKPTPIQKHSIPIVTAGRDLMACAQTGSGKTAAFVVPLISRLLQSQENQNPKSGKAVYPSVLVLAPTRELAAQTADESLKLSKRTHLRTSVVFGGVPIGGQISSLRYGCDIMIATPGRLIDIIEQGYVSLSKIQFLVLDEADRMLDMGFEPQIRKIVEKFGMPDKKYRQTLMFSATFPREIQNLAATFMKNYIFVTVGKVGKTCDTVKQQFIYMDNEETRKTALVKILTETPGLSLVFVETKRDASWLERYLRYDHKLPVTAIHGDKNQMQRTSALQSFASGRIPILIATNVAARGLDIQNVAQVVNYQMPATIEEYVHRIGRTGRAGKKGLATSFISQEDGGVIRDLKSILRDAKEEIPEWFYQVRGRRPPPGKRFSGGNSYHSNRPSTSNGYSYGGRNDNNNNNNSNSSNNANTSFRGNNFQTPYNYSNSAYPVSTPTPNSRFSSTPSQPPSYASVAPPRPSYSYPSAPLPSAPMPQPYASPYPQYVQNGHNYSQNGYQPSYPAYPNVSNTDVPPSNFSSNGYHSGSGSGSGIKRKYEGLPTDNGYSKHLKQ